MFSSLLLTTLILSMLDTKRKVQIARLLSTAIVSLRSACGLASEVTVERRRINWTLNLREGIDLAIYLLGGFEVGTLKRYQTLVREGQVVLDIGANIGAHTLPLAEHVGSSGKVYAFEPTAYAYGKLRRNMELNPHLADRIEARQMMLVATESEQPPESVYSSWPLEPAADLHEEHLGRLMSVAGATSTTLDGFVRQEALQQVDFVKLDVDGNEHKVLRGGMETLRRFKPTLMMELAPYVYRDRPGEFDDILRLLWDLGYDISNAVNGRRLPADIAAVRAAIPAAGGMNVIASVA